MNTPPQSDQNDESKGNPRPGTTTNVARYGDSVTSGNGAVADPHAAQTGEQISPTPQTAPAEEATRLYLEQIKTRIEQSAADAKSEARQLRGREAVLFTAFVITGIIGILVVLAGFVLIYFSAATQGVVAEIVGLLSGTGSAAFRHAGTLVEANRNDLNAREQSDRSLLDAIGVTLMIPDQGERTRAMVNLAGRLAEKVGPKPPARRSNRKDGR